MGRRRIYGVAECHGRKGNLFSHKHADLCPRTLRKSAPGALIRADAPSELAPHAARWDREKEFPREALKGPAELGLYGVAVPRNGAAPASDYSALAVACEEIAAGDCATATIVSGEQPGRRHPRRGNEDAERNGS